MEHHKIYKSFFKDNAIYYPSNKSYSPAFSLIKEKKQVNIDKLYVGKKCFFKEFKLSQDSQYYVFIDVELKDIGYGADTNMYKFEDKDKNTYSISENNLKSEIYEDVFEIHDDILDIFIIREIYKGQSIFELYIYGSVKKGGVQNIVATKP